ncbi:hypothetical protein [Streptomyces sp. SID13031]|uniref:hypothetical protein n=1 Tax=Streptomyces sp. SID13031 TaxID=2706046 RepID=UPI0013C9A12C|nr:hypothetical protein [Streptomyces sp. SID13031]NEA35552.1 hypothetical protein [Streptomyces sp. SID13031]
MPQHRNGRLVAVVASVAVAAVVVGGVVAYRQAPQTGGPAAAPLPGQSTPTPSTTPSKTAVVTPPLTPSLTPPSVPSKTPSSAPPGFTGPTKIALNLTKLAKGRDPQVPYLVGRVIRGGPGGPITIPGKQEIYEFARTASWVYAVVAKGVGTELIKDGPGDDQVERVPDVSAVVSSADGTTAAFSTTRTGELGQALKGGVLYFDEGLTQQKLNLPAATKLRVLAVVSGKVYFKANDDETGPSALYSWTPGAAKATRIKADSPTGISRDGRLVASRGLVSDGGSCTDIAEIATGKRLWKTCENTIGGFTPDGLTVFGGPAYLDGYCSRTASALDGVTGVLRREWSSCFLQTVPEDDQHLLYLADAENGQGEGNGQRAIIRCTIPTGACELATPLTKASVKIGQ